MQTVSQSLLAKIKAPIRLLSWSLTMSFTKAFDPTIAFFTIGVSSIGGKDIIAPDGSNVAQQWDKYNYTDYSNRVVSLEYDREQDPQRGGSILCQADMVLNNFDNLFTPSSTLSPIGNYVLPMRPVKFTIGFGKETVPIFVGLNETIPTIDDPAATAAFHCIDFMQFIFNIPLETAVLYQNYTTDQIISALLQTFGGLTTSQFTLDAGINIIPIFYASAGMVLGDVLRALAQAELGNLYMDELGRIRFANRYNWIDNETVPVWVFDQSNILEDQTVTDYSIVNVVEVNSQIRVEQKNQKYWDLQTPAFIPGNSTKTVTADFADPVITVDLPHFLSGATTSTYQANLASDGSGVEVTSGVSVAGTQYADSYSMLFTNTNAFGVYIYAISLFASPAIVYAPLYLRLSDDASVVQYQEQLISINNDYIQNESDANSLAQLILADNSVFNHQRKLTVVGIPQLQVGDLIAINKPGFYGTFNVLKIQGKLSGNSFVQDVTVISKQVQKFFRIGISAIGSTDEIGP